MENKPHIQNNTKAIQLLKALMCSYIMTGMLLLLLALLLYRLHLKENQVNVGIIVIYVISTFFGGFLTGKMIKVKKFLWGTFLGVLYFVLLFLVSLGVYKTIEGNGANIITAFILCVGGGMAGGMIS